MTLGFAARAQTPPSCHVFFSRSPAPRFVFFFCPHAANFFFRVPGSRRRVFTHTRCGHSDVASATPMSLCGAQQATSATNQMSTTTACDHTPVLVRSTAVGLLISFFFFGFLSRHVHCIVCTSIFFFLCTYCGTYVRPITLKFSFLRHGRPVTLYIFSHVPNFARLPVGHFFFSLSWKSA